MTECNLSEKRKSDGLRWKYYQKDVKEFIKLSEDIIIDPFTSTPEKLKKFKEIAGDKLL